MFKNTFIIIFSFFFSSITLSNEYIQLKDTDLIDYLTDKAERLSKLSNVPREKLPPIFAVSKATMNAQVCPEDPQNCRNLAAVFDDINYRILYLNDFEISQNFKPYDYSFIIHELVHAIQYLNFGAEIFNGCSAIYETEKLAYQVQDKYLEEEGAFERPGNFFRFSFYCDEEIAQKEYLLSKNVWDQRNSF